MENGRSLTLEGGGDNTLIFPPTRHTLEVPFAYEAPQGPTALSAPLDLAHSVDRHCALLLVGGRGRRR